jgi:hypothetical protein
VAEEHQVELCQATAYLVLHYKEEMLTEQDCTGLEEEEEDITAEEEEIVTAPQAPAAADITAESM